MHVDVAIVGGGVLGCATAYFLARAGGLHVAVFERNTIAAATTSRAAGLLCRSRPSPIERRMVRDTMATFDALAEHLDDPVPVHRVGSLWVAQSTATASAFATSAQTLSAEGDRVELLGSAEARRMAPWLAEEDVSAFVLFPEDGHVDPYLVGMAYAQVARRRGAEIHEGVEVTAVTAVGGRVTGVSTSEGPVAAGVVVDAAGPWASRLAWPLGAALPMAPVRSHYWITEPFDAVSMDGAVVIMPDVSAYARPEVGGLLFGLRDRESAFASPNDLPNDLAGFAFDDDYDGWRALEENGAAFRAVCPALETVAIAHYVSGPSAYTPDGKFVIGTIPGLDGFVAAAGCCGAGIGHSAGIGSAAAALARGEDPPYDLAMYDPARFGAFDPFDPAFLKRCAAARSAKQAG